MKGSAARATCLGLALTVVGTLARAADPATSSWSNVTSAASNGGMSALVTAAKAEGQLNVIALPLNWANYGAIIKDFSAKYGIKVNQAKPQGSKPDEVNAVNSEKAPARRRMCSTSGWRWPGKHQPLRTVRGLRVVEHPRQSEGRRRLWYQDYGGYMSIGYDSSKYTVTSVADLLTPAFKSAVALNGDPTEANAALNGVMLASLATAGRQQHRTRRQLLQAAERGR